jgi:hypothetical protein
MAHSKAPQDIFWERTKDLFAGYLLIGVALGYVAGAITFIGAYIYCIATYGFLFGLGLGWLPSIILAYVVGFVTLFLWGPAALGLLLLILGIWRPAWIWMSI